MRENAALVQICMDRDCRQPSVQVVDYGCVHEHLARDVTVCHECWRELMYLTARDRFICKVCEEAGHRCPLRIVRNESLGLRESEI